MIVSHKYRYVFVEIPHTGSHSIAEQLIKHYDGEPILRKHANVTQYLAQANAEEKRYFKFATVRNPLDSATTDYLKLKHNHKGQFTSEKARIENGGHVTRDHRREFQFIQEHDASFSEFFKKFRNRLYNNWFLIGDSHFDLVLRFESLTDDFSRVLEKLGIEQQEPLAHVNPTEGKRSYADFFTPDIYHQAARCYGPFMQKWNYPLPAEWGTVRVPLGSRAVFFTLDRCAGLAARHIELNPDNPLVHKAKKVMDRATSGRKSAITQGR